MFSPRQMPRLTDRMLKPLKNLAAALRRAVADKLILTSILLDDRPFEQSVVSRCRRLQELHIAEVAVLNAVIRNLRAQIPEKVSVRRSMEPLDLTQD